MDIQVKDKTVIVAASSSGLGRATAEEFAKEGAKVLISSRNEEQLKETCAEIKQSSGNNHIAYAVCDLTSKTDIDALIKQAIDWTGAIDVLITNAGGPPAGGFESFTDEDWTNAYELNVLSVVRLIRGVIPHMRKRGSGRIVNIASSSIKQSIDNLVLSNTFRAGINGLSKSLSQELAADHILINTVGPGRVYTGRVEALNQKQAKLKGITPEEVSAASEQTIPMGRYGKPEEFAKVVMFLASWANTYTTGQSLVVDGGLVKAL